MKRSGFGIGEAGSVPESTSAEDAEAQRLQPVRQPDYPAGRRLDCGHVVYWRAFVMGASLGSSCPDCFDRMSN